MENKLHYGVIIYAVLFIFIFILWIIGGGLHEIITCGQKRIESITALFGGFAFAGMIMAIYLQSKELSLQRKELEMTRQELHKTA